MNIELWSLLTPALRVRVILRNVFIIQQECRVCIYLFCYVINVESVH